MIKACLDTTNIKERDINTNESLLEPVYIDGIHSEHGRSVVLIDSSSNQIGMGSTITHLEKADSVILLYDMGNLETITPMSQYWLPLVEKHNPTIPVLIIGNKLDRVIKDEDRYVHAKVRRVVGMLFKKFKQVELGIECSVKDGISIKEALFSAQNMVLFPLSKLLCKQTKKLTKSFKKALHRIFRILDRDNDGWLDDEDISELQERVFKFNLTDIHVKNIKDSIAHDLEIGLSGGKINLEGFYSIFLKMLELVKIKNCWVG